MTDNKLLAVFDFDNTIIHGNSDTWITKLGQNGKLPKHIESLHKRGHWTAFMNQVFTYFDQECGVTESDYVEILKQIPLVVGMNELLREIKTRRESIDCIIISDANSFFINTILEQKGLEKVFTSIFTNPASFSSSGRLCVAHYHQHSHEKCPVNMCKAKILRSYMANQEEQGIEYESILYVGDGSNDYCPSSILSEKDFVFPRKGYSLERVISKPENVGEICAKVMIWENAQKILAKLQELLV